MCCNGYSKTSTPSDHIEEDHVASPLPDGYWLAAFPFSDDNTELPDLVGYGLGFAGKPSAIKLFLNPGNDTTDPIRWKVLEIQSLEFPVAMVYADLTGNGFNDIIISDRYGPSMGDLWDGKTNNGGRIQWLRNPGNKSASQLYWEPQHIGNSTGMHRLQVGHFTSRDVLQVMGVPIIAASNDVDSPAPIIIFTPSYGSDKTLGPVSWSEDIAFASEFRLIHDVKLLPSDNNGLDMVLVAGREGIVLLWFDEGATKWSYNVVGTGLPEEAGSPYWGSGSVDIARFEDNSVGYLACCEGFHGNTVSVYINRDPEAPSGAASLKTGSWERIVIDNFGSVDSEQHTGTVHHVAAVRVRNDNSDSFAIACMGAPVSQLENQGVYLYSPVNLAEGLFKKTKITGESAGRLAIAGFSDPSRQDIASISYYVPGYHTGPDTPNIRINSLNSSNVDSHTSIVAKKLNKEVLLLVPRPTTVPEGSVPTMPILTIAGKKTTLTILRPGEVMKLGDGDGVKVVYGSITMQVNGVTVTRSIAPAAKDIASTHILSDDRVVTAGEDGTIFLLVEPLKDHFQGPYKTMSQVTTQNVFPTTAPANVRAMEFPFVKVETLDWASSGLWDDFEFYNMTGFHVYFNDDAMEEVVHIQAWTLGIGETARFHNHSDKSFCEIHYCLSNGGGLGGMRYFADDYTQPIDTEAELTKNYVEKNSTLLVVPSMYEHGPLWKIQPGTNATPKFRENGTVDYPWHAWLASGFGDHTLPIQPPLPEDIQRYDLWMAFEFPSTAFNS